MTSDRALQNARGFFRGREWGVVAGVICVCTALFYLQALGSFFANDDWVLIYYYGKIPWWRFWEFFSSETIWFYRPFQSLQFGSFYQFFGLNPVPYNLSLIVMHVVVCFLVYTLVRDLSRNAGLAALTLALFAFSWLYTDILIWKANFNTLHWALATLGACVCFLRWMRTRRPGWLIAAYAFAILNFFTKEMAVNLPFLLLLIWMVEEAKISDFHPRRWGWLVRQSAPAWAVPALFNVIYIIWHRTMLTDIAVEHRVGYFFASPLEGLIQALFAYNHTILSFHADPLLLPQAPGVRQVVEFIVRYLLVLPFLLLFLAWRRGDRVLAFGTGWIFLSFVPAVFLEMFHGSRFYYLPAIGSSLIQARLVQLMWRHRPRSRPAAKPLAAIAAVIVVYLFIVNLSRVQLWLDKDAGESAKVLELYALLSSNRDNIESPLVIVLRNQPITFFKNGLGLREFVKFALDDPAAEGVVSGQSMDPERVRKLKALGREYLVDMAEPELKIIPLAPESGR